MKNFLLLIILFVATAVNAQNGYIKLRDDSTLVGFLRPYTSVFDGHQGIEFWRTKKDKSPLQIPKRKIEEYAIKKDTFKIFHQFKPFHDSQIYFEMIDAKLETGGKVCLYRIDDPQNPTSPYLTGGLVPAMIIEFKDVDQIYVLAADDGQNIMALPFKKEKLTEALMDFYSEDLILEYIKLNGTITYKKIPELVKYFNAR